ncbi:type I-E CRISPR-associated endoribonuclease Cas2e [Tetragenococcus halophilus]|uniref:type I-E CRISPR-associated endoribonuclease Cas2e n=1 Tax=Tetragenococcus halophilus TaxID=51669 RepID=UPI00102F9D43|nr:type I-E CRISPR-associated endoribonuclease Cas2e [Tetragenococcus halophilus]MCO7025648.1 type I-E CRISPR-associated endoribonuclease Cas2e [Tetragenococcus halophilus]GMG63246.1 type I-E CRISPR-associated endoribonuclease Cas2e [Tetragenococcus halophilus]GMG65878.1 type I-E CRISPR-associated endoribonuclease Cas2e [Tetragenococcus halophilus]GMG67568.1 type I-E CRISPR-associated endoribonuclease Cas2e [Tetragenococcus halophilus]GMG70561.1 type I-E CRISPR-associated endoribonuclease Cas2
MPFTVITLKKVPNSLRGDLTKWMQEIATGVYVGNFNTKVRSQLWERVIQSVGTGEATMSYVYRNEIGYQFETLNTQRQVADYDGIPLVILPKLNDEISKTNYVKGYSNAAKFQKAKKYSKKHSPTNKPNYKYVVIDIETDGLNYNDNQIIEIGAVKMDGGELTNFHRLIKYDKELPSDITKLTGITQDLLAKNGQPLKNSLVEFVDFIEDFPIVGYGIDFDLRFLNKYLKDFDLFQLSNIPHDLIRYVKREKMLLTDYKLKTALISYGFDDYVPHRALEDAKIIYQLSTKVNKFLKAMN